MIDNATDFNYLAPLYSQTLRETPIAFSPELTMTNTLSYTYRGFEAAFTHQFVGKQYLDNLGLEAHSLPSYQVSSLRLGYTLPVSFLRHWSLHLQVNNLLNAKYASNGYVNDYAKAQTGPDYSEVKLYPQAGIHFLMGTTISL